MSEILAEYYRHLFNGSPFAIIGTDGQGVIVSWNRSAEGIFHSEPSRMLGRHLAEIVPPEQRSLFHAALEQAVTSKQPADFEIEQSNKQGQKQILAGVITPIIDDQDQILGLATWISDITRRKNLEIKLAQTEKIASLGTLASGVAHHFNNIMGGVATFVDFALNSDNPQASRRALQMTAEAANRVAEITQSLLTFAEKDARQFDLSDLTEVLLTFSHLVERPLAEKNIKLELHMQGVPIFEVPGSRMHQVLGNLLDNAEHALPRGGTVAIDLQRQDEQLVLRFSDNGFGIEPKDLPHIFEPFYTTRGVSGGGDQTCAGLGLSVVHGVVRELGGNIDVASRLGKGTTFTIRFCLPQKS
ncbi:MAG: hypothetical protein AMJ79_11000 [Phycisphaerae bacterium SM23_30]|nr:MAG: hypothetical protein AMJ79_11000 [Phycisphaerae bacterium SM23_30]